MALRPATRSSAHKSASLRLRVYKSLGLGLLGGFLGWGYWYLFLPEHRDDRWLMNMYGCLGAVAGLMSVRVYVLFSTMFHDFFGDR